MLNCIGLFINKVKVQVDYSVYLLRKLQATVKGIFIKNVKSIHAERGDGYQLRLWPGSSIHKTGHQGDSNLQRFPEGDLWRLNFLRSTFTNF